MKDALLGAATLTTAIWWITAITTRTPDAYPRAAFALCLVTGAIHPDIHPILTAIAGAIAHRDIRRACLHYRYGRSTLD